ncbi:MAG: helix-turn-helix domain-containing protein [Akkermansiaceae bacterium]
MSEDGILSKRFQAQLQTEPFLELVSALPDVYLFAKDAQSRFRFLNRLAWEGLGVNSEVEALEKTDADFHPPTLAMAYREEDRQVMDQGPIFNRVWLVHHLGLGLPQWVVSSKAPLKDASGKTVGVLGSMYPLESAELRARYFQELEPAVRYLETHFSETVEMNDVAARVPCSRTQLNRRFQALLHMTPTQFLIAQRIQTARRLLATTDREVAEVATSVGFYDQSHFTRRFRAVTGQTPAAYRRSFRK